MTTGVVPVDPRRDPRWDAFLQRQPKAGLFHSSAWIDVTERAYGYSPAHLAYVSEDTVEGILPLVQVRSALTGNRLVSLPFSGPVGPLGNSEAVVEALVDAAIERTAELRCSYLHLQVAQPLPERSHRALASSRPIVCSVISLEDGADHLWRTGLRQTLRYDIRRARRLGVSVEVRRDQASVDTFYGLHTMTHRKHGIPPQPRRLFNLLRESFDPRDAFWMLVASVGGRPIQAMLCLEFKNVLSAVYAGTDPDSREYRAVKLVDWCAIELAVERHLDAVDLLQSDVEQTGLRWYKRGFGAQEIPLTSYFYPASGLADVLKSRLVRGDALVGRLARSAVRRIPDAGLRLLGAAAFRHMG